MKTNRKTAALIVLILLIALSFAAYFIIHDNGDEPLPIEEKLVQEFDEDNDVIIEEELEGSEIEKAKEEPPKFIGKWTATSAQAEYLYGNVDIEIKGDNTWTANVTEEEFDGTWVQDEYGITLTSSLLDCKFYFSTSGKLIMEDYRFEDSGDPLITVLTKR